MQVRHHLRNFSKWYLYKFFLILFILGIIASSCSNDESGNNESVELDTDPPQDYDGITINFQLQNPNGLSVKSFREGENIIFTLSLTNRTSEEAIMPNVMKILGENTFRVYSKDGRDLGLPWDYLSMSDAMMGAIRLPQGASRTFICSWLNDPEIEKEGFGKDTVRYPLPRGEYYTQYDLSISDNKKVTYKKEFKIF